MLPGLSFAFRCRFRALLRLRHHFLKAFNDIRLQVAFIESGQKVVQRAGPGVVVYSNVANTVLIAPVLFQIYAIFSGLRLKTVLATVSCHHVGNCAHHHF